MDNFEVDARSAPGELIDNFTWHLYALSMSYLQRYTVRSIMSTDEFRDFAKQSIENTFQELKIFKSLEEYFFHEVKVFIDRNAFPVSFLNLRKYGTLID